jgi:hypothetical protein
MAANYVESPSTFIREGIRQYPTPAIWTLAKENIERWVAATETIPYWGRWCFSKLVNRRHHCDSDRCHYDDTLQDLPILDHSEWWCAGDGKFYLTGHPYGLRGLPELVEFCAPRGIGYQALDPAFSWYLPGRTSLIVLKGT